MISLTTFTEAGGHPDNEDAFLVEPHPREPTRWLCFLADGVGGRRGGARAAQLACEASLNSAKKREPNELQLASTWINLFADMDCLLHADREAGFTTLIGFTIQANQLTGASCGDSALLVRNGDDTFLELTAGQSKNPPFGSSVARGFPFALELIGEWSVLAMTDGVWKYGGWERIIEAMKTEKGESLLNQLQSKARLPGSGQFPDDFTVVLIENKFDD